MTKMHQVIFLNGPRKSGKDTAANHIQKEWPDARLMKFASPLKASLRAFFGVSDALWKELEGPGNNDAKLVHRPEFFGLSWVDALIWYSEEMMKPKFGADIFGQLAFDKMLAMHPSPVTVFSDCRFSDEMRVIIKQYGSVNCHVFQLHRDGCTFTGDSGSYLRATDLPSLVNWQTVNNQYEPSMFRRQILMRVNRILGMQRTFG